MRETNDATPGSIVVGKLGAGEALTVGETTLNAAKLADLAREPRTVIDDAKGTLTLTGYDAASGTLTYRYDPKAHASPDNQQATVDFIIGREAFRGTNGVGVQPFNPRWAGDDSAAIEESYARAAALGVKWVRITAGWNQVQPQDDGSYDWRYVDDAVRLAQKYGMKVLMQVMGTPNWASDIGDLPAAQQQKLAQEGYWTSTHAPKPQHDAAFARFFGEAVKRYSAQGIHDYEFWNEPGNKFWRDSWANPNPNPEHYTRLLKLVYEAAHAADAEANVLAGGMTVGDSRADGSYISPQEFLERMYKAGAQGYFDALSHHPYGILAKDFKDNGWAQMNGDIVAPGAGEKTLMQIMQAHGDGGKLIWPSEVGWDAMFAGLAETWQANTIKTLLEWQQKADYTGPMILYQAQNDRAAYVPGILNRDDNGDGIVDVNIDTNGDGIPDANIDADHNNRPDLLDAADREAYYGFWKNDGSEKPAVGVIKSGTPQTPAAATLNITIENVDTPPPPQNHAPDDITLSTATVAEGKDGTTVGKLTAHDPDSGDTHTYTVSDARFEVTSDGTLKLKAGQHLDYASEPTVKLTVTATDAGGLSTQKTFTLNVQDDPAYPAPPTVGARESGLNLDIARHFYSADVIKQFIDTLAKAGGTFLHLHLSDHENYALESALLGQRAQDATRDSAGNHVNPHTGKPFLSTAQVAELASYAKAKGIELVPELETPSHMNAIFRLLALEKGEDYVKALQAANSDPAAREIDITRPQSLAFVQALAQEIATAFGDSARHLHLGGDEFGYSAANNHEYINYINQMAAFLAQHGLKTRIWNDGVIKANLASLDHTIEITYWSHDGRQDGSIGETNRALRASVPELLDAGFNVLNYNAGYLYAVPKQGMGDSTDSNYDSRLILRDWNPGIWDEKNHANAVDGKRLKGAALSIWGENAGTLDDASIARYYADEITTLVEKTRALDDPALAQTLQNRAANDFAALQQDTWLDFEQIANHATLDLGGNGSQHLRLLREDTLDAARGLDIRIKGTDADRITLGDNWHATGDSQTEGGEQYRAYENNGNRLWIDSDIAVQNAAPTSAADTFARDNLPPGAAYQIVADLGAAKTAIAADPTLQNLIISDGNHHALLQKNSTGYSDGMPPGWTLTCKNHIPAVAFHDGGADLAPALNAAAQAAKTLQLGIELPAQREYQLGSQIVLENGVPYLHGNGSTLAVQNSVNEAALKLPNGASQGEISGLTLNMNAAPGVHGILGYDLHDYRIHDNHILHLGQRPGHPGYGITVYSGSGHTENITVENNHISAKPSNGAHADAPVGIAFNGAQQPGNPQWRDAKAPVWRQYVEDGTVAEADPSRTIKHITVRGNQVSGTYYGVAFSTVSDSEISGNHLHHNTRNISLQDRSNHNTVRDNILTDAHSSAIHIAYASSDNHIENNHIMTTRAGGQAILQAYQGSKNNHYHNNHIDVAHDATTNFMYTATDSSGTTYRDNIASGRVSRASIGAESIWDKAGAGDEKSAYGNNMQDPNLYDGDITHGGGHGALTGLTISGNILAPEPTFAGAPITYLGADSSHGLHGDKTLHGDLDATLNDNTWLGADGREAIRQHQSGDSHVHLHGNGITHADGTTYHHGTTAYSIGDYTLANDETTLYLLGTHATSGSGNSGDNQLYGNAQTNRLSGGAGNDHLDGGYGADTLTGGAGADTFTFASLLDGKNIDTITDFNAGEGDKIALNQAVFGRLGDNWYTAAGQHITHTTRVYQQGDTLYHDPDGSGSAYSATAFAKVNTVLEEGHFSLI